jgi:UV DNA damage endonuclease
MRLGFAVKVLGAGGLPSHDTRRHRSGPHLSVSLDRLDAILGYLEDNAIGMYRMATARIVAEEAVPSAAPA